MKMRACTQQFAAAPAVWLAHQALTRAPELCSNGFSMRPNAKSAAGVALLVIAGLSVARGVSAQATPQPPSEPAPVEPPTPAGVPTNTLPNAPRTLASGAGYTWGTRPNKSKAATRPARRKVDPRRTQAKGPEFVVAADGTSQITVQLSKRVDVNVKTQGTTIVYTLPNVQVAVTNDTNPLITKDFVTPVATARLVESGKHAKLVITLKQAASPAFEVVDESEGAALLRVTVQKTAAPVASGKVKSTAAPASTPKPAPRAPK